MFCKNLDCNKKTIAESFSFLAFKSKKTSRLEDEIVSISKSVSSLAAEKILKKNTLQVGKSTICNILKKSAVLINKFCVTKVCIDDFALKRREKYGTVMFVYQKIKLII